MTHKNILGLDIGTNSIGAAVVCVDENGEKRLACSPVSRIIPMPEDEISKFNEGTQCSSAADRRGKRTTRRMMARFQLRRERIFRVLNVLGFLPKHFSEAIDFEKRLGKFKVGRENEKIEWDSSACGGATFIFEREFEAMVTAFKSEHPNLINRNFSRDWVLYFLRKEALSRPISKEALAWILISFNAKRGYKTERGDDDDNDKKARFTSVKVDDVVFDNESKGKKWFRLELSDIETGEHFSKRRPDIDKSAWIKRVLDVVIEEKSNGEPAEVRFVKPDDWMLKKEKREKELRDSGKTVGEYIFDALLKNPDCGIRKKLGTIGREYYRKEAQRILEKQAEFLTELRDRELFKKCVCELYRSNENHRNLWLSGENQTLANFILDDVIFYQRPLKSKKSEIDVCRFEKHTGLAKGSKEKKSYGVRCAARSNPFCSEFRIWKFISNLRVKNENPFSDDNLTDVVLKTSEQKAQLFDWLNNQSSVNEKDFLSKFCGFGKKESRYYKDFNEGAIHWNYLGDKKKYPCNPVRAEILKRAKKCGVAIDLAAKVIRRGKNTSETVEYALWHVLYSVGDRDELEKALRKFSVLKICDSESGETRDLVPEEKRDGFVDEFVKIKKLDKLDSSTKGYAAFSEKALRKLLPLMRCGKYWSWGKIPEEAKSQLDAWISKSETIDEKLFSRAENNGIKISCREDAQAIPEWIATYLVYGRHSEAAPEEIEKWESPEDITKFISKEFRHNSLRNPTVEKVVLETLRVVRDIWKQLGQIDEIHIELGREIAQPAEKRKEMTKRMVDNETENLRIRRILMELKESGAAKDAIPGSPSHQDILKLYEQGVWSRKDDEFVQDNNDDNRSKLYYNEDIENVSNDEIKKYRSWLEERYKSPYTGKSIPLSELFTEKYEIEHVIPRARFFDNSLSNKVICEAAVNKEKGDRLAMEFINEMNGGSVKGIQIQAPEDYKKFVEKNYSGKKKEFLLATEIPQRFTNSQLVNTQYISKYVRNLLSRIVRKTDADGRVSEDVAVSSNIISCTGIMTDALKRDWGLNDVWNDLTLPRFLSMNEKTGTQNYTAQKRDNGGLTGTVPLDEMKNFRKKRIDHRHHAMDAVVIACCTRDHVQLMSNEAAGTRNKFADLRKKLRVRVGVKIDKNGVEHPEYAFQKPWKTFTEDVKAALKQIFPTFKTSTRVLSKGRNRSEKLEKNGQGVVNRIQVTQDKGDIRKIRQPLHKETFYSISNLQNKEAQKLEHLLNPDVLTKKPHRFARVCDKALRQSLIRLYESGISSAKGIRDWFKNNSEKFPNVNLNKIESWVYSEETRKRIVAARSEITHDIKLEKITDESIRKTLEAFLAAKMECVKDGGESEKKKETEARKIAFSQAGLEEMNANIEKYTPNHKPHKPIWRVRIADALGEKYPVGGHGEKAKKLVESAKGTNLYFAVYRNSSGERKFATIPLRVAIENVKKNKHPVPTVNENGAELYFYFSPNDIVYLPREKEVSEDGTVSVDNIDKERLFRVVKFSGERAWFTHAPFARSLNKKYEHEEELFQGASIKKTCLPVKTDRLGNIIKIGV